MPSPAPYLTPTLLLPLLLPYSYLTPTSLPPYSHLTYLLLASPISSLPPLSLLTSPTSSSPHLPSSSPHIPPPYDISPISLRTRWATLCSAELEWISQLEIAQLEISQLEISQLEGAEGAAAGLGAGSS